MGRLARCVEFYGCVVEGPRSAEEKNERCCEDYRVFRADKMARRSLSLNDKGCVGEVEIEEGCRH